MLGADTRSTSDTTVADKNCEKIHFIAPNIYCCGAGTAADTENVTGKLCSCLLSSWGRFSKVEQAQQFCCCRACVSRQHSFCCRYGVLRAGAAQVCDRPRVARGDRDDHAEVPPVQARHPYTLTSLP